MYIMSSLDYVNIPVRVDSVSVQEDAQGISYLDIRVTIRLRRDRGVRKGVTKQLVLRAASDLVGVIEPGADFVMCEAILAGFGPSSDAPPKGGSVGIKAIWFADAADTQTGAVIAQVRHEVYDDDVDGLCQPPSTK